METIINKVAESGIVTLDLAPFIPGDTIAAFDIRPFLFREMILREKDYRAALAEYDWQQFSGRHVAIYCTADAIVPVWAYMLAVFYLQNIAASVYFGTPTELIKVIIEKRIAAIDANEYEGKRVVLKGCGDTHIPEAAYVAATQHLLPVVKSLMYGEPCSTVPVFKRK